MAALNQASPFPFVSGEVGRFAQQLEVLEPAVRVPERRLYVVPHVPEAVMPEVVQVPIPQNFVGMDERTRAIVALVGYR